MPEDDIIRPAAMYKQLAARIAHAITTGDYPPGSILPSETQLIDRYKVSRPTVRSAIAELRTMGLVESVHGKGTYVRKAHTPATTLHQTITRTGKRYVTGTDAFTAAETPTVTRTTLTHAHAALLGRDEGDAAFSTERLLTDPGTSARVLHRTLIPFDTADQTPAIAEQPDAEPAQLYDALATAGHALTWAETVTARAPMPDERAALNAPDTAAILITHRTTHGTNDQPLILEEQRISAEAAQLTYRITTDKAPSKRPTPATGPESA